MADEINGVSGGNNVNNNAGTRKVIEETNFQFSIPKPKGPSAIGKGGDPFFRNINAPKDQIQELLEETTVVQDWMNREASNNAALACLDNENLKEIYYEIKDGFGEYGPIMLMGFKTPQGVEIPRLKLLDKNGDVIEVLTGPMAMDELNKRALAFRSSTQDYEQVETQSEENVGVIQDYSGNPDDYV